MSKKTKIEIFRDWGMIAAKVTGTTFSIGNAVVSEPQPIRNNPGSWEVPPTNGIVAICSNEEVRTIPACMGLGLGS